jgi:MFS family permease
VVVALDRRISRASLAGVCAGAAVMVRPNLGVVLVAVLLGLAVLERGWRVAWPLPRRALVAGLAALPFVAVVALINNAWYGAPWNAGYGSFSEQFDRANVLPNVLFYGRSIAMTQSPFVFLALVPLVRGNRREAVFFGLFFAAFAVAYLPYSQFAEWWYLRFFLPAILVALVLALAGARQLLRSRLAFAFVAAMMAICGFFFLGRLLDQHRYQRAYVSVARFIDRGLPSNAAVISMQHSGSVRYYAGRLTVRWDWMRGETLDRVIADLQALGYRPYILLEDWEVPRFTSRFSSESRAGQLRLPVVAEMDSPMKAQIYDPLAPEDRTLWPPAEKIPALPFRGCPARAETRNW